MVAAGNDIAVRGLARRLGQRWAVAGVDFRLPAGGALMLTGANGSGKTTLLRILSTALRPHRGTVAIGGADAWSERQPFRGQIALFSHATRLYEDLSAADNLRVWARLGGYAVDVDAALEEVGLVRREESVRAYSAGMRRRLALAVALLKRPRIALFDEPFTALDPAGRDMVGKTIETLRQSGATVIIATHMPRLTQRYCDQAIHLDQGRIAWSGNPSAAPAVEMEA